MELLKILTFRIGSRYFGLASKNVKEILDSCGNLKGIFYGVGALKGLLNFEGDIISVLDSSVILGISGGEALMVLLCKEKGMEKAVGLAITEVRGMKIVAFSSVEAPHHDDPPYVSGFLRDDEDKEGGVILLDLQGFLDYADTKIERLN